MKLKDWWLGGDPNCDCDEVLGNAVRRKVRIGPIPQFRERKRIQDNIHATYERAGLSWPCTRPGPWIW